MNKCRAELREGKPCPGQPVIVNSTYTRGILPTERVERNAAACRMKRFARLDRQKFE